MSKFRENLICKNTGICTGIFDITGIFFSVSVFVLFFNTASARSTDDINCIEFFTSITIFLTIVHRLVEIIIELVQQTLYYGYYT